MLLSFSEEPALGIEQPFDTGEAYGKFVLRLSRRLGFRFRFRRILRLGHVTIVSSLPQRQVEAAPSPSASGASRHYNRANQSMRTRVPARL